MEYSMTAEFAPQRAAWMLWPLGNNVLCVNEIPLQKIFARVAMAISMATPTFVVVPKNQVDRASFIIPKHINLVTVDEYNYGLMNNFPFIVFLNQKAVLAPNSSIKSIALSGKKRSLIYWVL